MGAVGEEVRRVELQFVVPPAAEGQPLGRFLRSRGVTAGMIRAVKHTGDGFFADDRPLHTNQPVHAGQRVCFALPPDPPTSVVPQPVPPSNAAADLPGVNLTGDENYVALEATGKGIYVGLVLNVDNFNVSNQQHPWFVEGDDMIFIDGESWPPSIHGTGLEDYFHSAWCFPTGEYESPYYGTSLASDTQEHFGKWSLYRFHVEEPIYFQKSIRVTFEHGHNNDQANVWSSVAYWFLLAPHIVRPARPDVDQRLARRWPDFGIWNR